MNRESSETITITKGEDIVKMVLKRTPSGLRVCLKTVHPAIEEMFREWAAGELVPHNAHGRKWIFQDKSPAAYGIALFKEIAGSRKCKGGRYRLDSLGTDVFAPGITGDDPTVNLAFLRLVGVSGGGISFVVRGVYSQESMTQMKELFSQAILQLYLDFIKPIDVVITITSSEASRE